MEGNSSFSPPNSTSPTSEAGHNDPDFDLFRMISLCVNSVLFLLTSALLLVKMRRDSELRRSSANALANYTINRKDATNRPSDVEANCSWAAFKGFIGPFSTPKIYLFDKVIGDAAFLLLAVVEAFFAFVSLKPTDVIYTPGSTTSTMQTIDIAIDAIDNACWAHAVLTHVLMCSQHYRIATDSVGLRAAPGILLPRCGVRTNLLLIWLISAAGGAWIEFCYAYWMSHHYASGQLAPQLCVTIPTFLIPLGVIAVLSVKISTRLREEKANAKWRRLGAMIRRISTSLVPRRREAVVSFENSDNYSTATAESYVSNHRPEGSVEDAFSRKVIRFTVLFTVCFLPYHVTAVAIAAANLDLDRLSAWQQAVKQTADFIFGLYFVLYPVILFHRDGDRVCSIFNCK